MQLPKTLYIDHLSAKSFLKTSPVYPPSPCSLVFFQLDRRLRRRRWRRRQVSLCCRCPCNPSRVCCLFSPEVRMDSATVFGMRLMIPLSSFLALLVVTGVADALSILKKGHGCSIDSPLRKSGNTILGCTPSSEKYLLESYFEQKYKLGGVEFCGYLAQKFCKSNCQTELEHEDFVVKLSSLGHYLIGEGSHRHMVSSLQFNYPSSSKQPVDKEILGKCEALIVERLPSGVFADPFELQHLVRRGVFAEAAVFGDANLELPSALSNFTAVEVHVSLNLDHLRRNQVSEITVEIPLHARYPPLSQHGYEEIKFNDPDILLRCKLSDAANEKYLWVLASPEEGSSTKAGSNDIWKVPSGNESHSSFVSAITFLSALVAAFCIVLTALYPHSSTTTSSIKKDS